MRKLLIFGIVLMLVATVFSGCIEVAENKAPTAEASALPTEGIVPLLVYFEGGGNDTDGAIVEYFWEFEEGETSSEQNTYHIFEKIGVYVVSLTVYDDIDASDKAYVTIIIELL